MSSAATHRHAQKARKPETEPEETAERDDREGPITTYLEEHEWPRLTAGVAAAAGAGLLAASMLGVGPVLVAGAAGYVAFRELRGKQPSESAPRRAHR